MITVIDYGLGNVRAFLNLYKRLNIAAATATAPEQLLDARKLILPGVGSFDHAMTLLDRSGMRAMLDELVVERGVPVLGICVGMQILGKRSDEGRLPGLGWIDGEVRKLPHRASDAFRLPHMGWNDVVPAVPSALFEGLTQDARFYFLHSYYFHCHQRDKVLAETDYGLTFSSAVHAGNIFGVQFHPEKSHHFGMQLLKNFAEL
jgi:glutamine amidotransferase